MRILNQSKSVDTGRKVGHAELKWILEDRIYRPFLNFFADHIVYEYGHYFLKVPYGIIYIQNIVTGIRVNIEQSNGFVGPRYVISIVHTLNCPQCIQVPSGGIFIDEVRGGNRVF